jgi:ATP-dependent Clp protease ATP-binding subunit ClpA
MAARPIERLDHSALHVMISARAEASRAHAAQVEAQHLLVGLLTPPIGSQEPYETRAVRMLLVGQGLTLSGARAAVAVGTASISEADDMPVADDTYVVLDGAAREADARSRTRLNAIDIALGLFRASEPARTILEKHGVTEATLRELY